MALDLRSTGDLCLPRRPPRACQLAAMPPNNTTLLLLSPDTDTTALIHALLRAKGYRMLSAPDGPAGLKALRSQQPDLLLLDAGLDEPNLALVLEALSQTQTPSPVPLLLLGTLQELAQLPRTTPAEDLPVLVKPFAAHQLRTKVKECLAR